MLKRIAFNTISLLLIFSILAPSVVTLLNSQKEAVLVIDMTDEENQKESQKKFDEKELFFHNQLKPVCFFESRLPINNSLHLFVDSDFSIEIFLPPPERLV